MDDRVRMVRNSRAGPPCRRAAAEPGVVRGCASSEDCAGVRRVWSLTGVVCCLGPVLAAVIGGDTSGRTEECVGCSLGPVARVAVGRSGGSGRGVKGA